MTRKSIFFFWLICIAISGKASDGEGRLMIRHYSDEVYRGHPVNWSCTIDQNGTIYFGNRSVVLAYNGVDWKKIRIKLDAPVYSLQRGKDGRIFLGTHDDFGYLATDSTGNTVFRSLARMLPDADKKFGKIWKIHIIEEAVYFQSNTHLFRLLDDKFTIWKPEGRFHFSFVIDDQVYIRENDRGLLRLQNDILVPFSDLFSGNKIEDRIYGLLPYNHQNLLAVTRGRGLFLIDRNSGSTLPFHTSQDSLFLEGQPYGAILLSNGTFAVNTLSKGVIMFNSEGEITRVINKDSGLKTQNIRHLYQDMQGALWLSSDEGVYRVGIDIPMTFWDARDGLEGSLLHLAEFNGNSYVASSKGVYLKKNNRFIRIEGLNEESWKFQVYRHQDKERLLVATSAGVFEVNESKATQLTESHCRFLYINPRIPDIVWVSERDQLALYQYDDNGLKKIGAISGIRSIIQDIEEDPEGNIWIGTDFEGLYKISGFNGISSLLQPDLQLYTKKDGFNLIEEIRIEIYQDTLVALAGHATYQYLPEADRFEKIVIGKSHTKKDSLETIFLDIDSTGGYWIQRNETDYSLLLERAFFTPEKGFLVETIPFKMIPRKLARQVVAKPDGKFWILFNNAIFTYDSRQFYMKEKRHITLINKLVTNRDTTFYSTKRSVDDLTQWGLPGELAYKFNDIAFWFNSSCLRNEASNSYQYLLAGDDTKWSEWSSQPVAYFTNLHEGDYQFMVRSRGFDEIPSEVSVYRFTILPPWYRSVPTYIFYFLLGILCIWFLLKLNTRRIRKQKMILEAKVTTRTAEILNQNLKIRSQQKEILNQNKELQLLNKEKNFLLGAVAHDLKNPLNSIYSVSQLIKMDDEQLDEEQREYIHQIGQISLGLTDKVNEILDVTVIDAKQNKVPLKRGEVSCLVAEIVKNLQPIASRKDIRLNFQNPETTYFAYFEANYMKKALQNLLDNAIKFSPKGKEVFICMRHTGEKLQIRVRDEGPGITPADRKRLFDRFTTLSARPTNGEKSTGLGLSIVKRCVEAMNGKVWCESEPGQGATFIIEI